MDTGNNQASVKFLKDALQKLIKGQYPMDLLVITKSLKPTYCYKDPSRIAHWVLAKRMGDRDPGNKPQPNSRIPYAYIVKKKKRGEKILQGDRIESPKYIIDNKLKLDYEFYITNQIKRPVSQIYDLIDGIDSKELFSDAIRTAENKRLGHNELGKWFSIGKKLKK